MTIHLTLALLLLSPVLVLGQASAAAPQPSAAAGAAAPAAAATAKSAAEAGAVHGRVRDTTGGVLAGAEVQIQAEHPVNGAAAPRVVTTETDGGYRLAPIPAGAYRLTASIPGFEPATVTVTVRPGVDRLVDLTLSPSGIAQEVTVTATRVATPVTALPNTVTVLDNAALRRRTATSEDLASLLEASVPGFSPSQKKLTSRGETLRGRDPLYTVNGVPQNTPLRDGDRDSHTIDIDFLERVEVIHGANAIQGIGATGGVVSLVTKSPKADGTWTHDFKLSLGTHDSFDGDSVSSKLSYLVGRKIGRFDFMLGAAIHERGMFKDAHGDYVGMYVTQGDIMDSTQRGLYAKAGVDLGRAQRVEVTVNDFRLARNGGYGPLPGDRAAGRLTGSVEGDPSAVIGDPGVNDATTVSAEYRNRDAWGGDATIQAFTYDYWARYEGTAAATFTLTPGGAPFLDQSAITTSKVGAKLTYALPRGRLAGFSPTVGLDLTRDESAQVLTRTDRVWVPYTVLHDVAPFFQVQRTLSDRVLVSGGLRLEAAGISVDDFTTLPSYGSQFVEGGSPSFTDVLPNVGVVVYPAKALSVYSSFSEGFTMPDVGRVLRAVNRPGQRVDSLIDLDPVVTSNLEFGLDYRGTAARVHADYYRSGADRGSLLEVNPDGIFEVRRETTAIDGVDLLLELPLRRGDWLAGATFAWLRGRFDSDGDARVDSDLDGVSIAPNRLNVYAQGSIWRKLSGRLQVSTLLPRDFRGPGARANRDFGGYTTADLSLAFETAAGVIRLGVENLLDKQYVTYFSQTEPNASNDTFFAGQGRGVMLSLERRF